MSGPIVYDKAKWHSDGDYPADLPQRNAFNHTGFFLGWLIDNDLLDAEITDEFPDAIEAFRRRDTTGPALYRSFDGALDEYMLNDEGNAFAQCYFDFDTGQYLNDYDEILSSGLPTMYHVDDTWENYDKLKQRIDQRFNEWRAQRGQPT